MSSYFDYYCSQLENYTANKAQYVKGICYTMCPQDEMKLRERENMIHVLEVWGSERKLVKSYCRSAADVNIAIPKYLRPFPVLKDTVKYLLLDVTKRIDVSSLVIYNYVTDRLRAVRQDMTVQGLPPYECVRLLDPMVRFHVYYGYKLCNLPQKDYDPVLNKKYLLECIKWFLNCWDAMVEDQNIDTVDDLSRSLNTLKIQNKNDDLPCDRILMEMLYILCNMNYIHPLIRYISLPKNLRNHPLLYSAYEAAIANWKRNYVKVGKALDTSCPLSYCALYSYLPEMQRQALEIMSHAYNNKRFIVPCQKLRQWLCLSCSNEVIQICAHYGLEVIGDGVRFTKGTFNSTTPIHQLEPRKLREKLDLSIDNIFWYNINDGK